MRHVRTSRVRTVKTAIATTALPPALAAALISVWSGGRAVAATWTWTGGAGNDHWTNTPNWSPVSRPASDGTADVIFAGTSRLTPDMNANWNINSLSFDTTAGGFELGSSTASTLTLGAGGITDSSASL